MWDWCCFLPLSPCSSNNKKKGHSLWNLSYFKSERLLFDRKSLALLCCIFYPLLHECWSSLAAVLPQHHIPHLFYWMIATNILRHFSPVFLLCLATDFRCSALPYYIIRQCMRYIKIWLRVYVYFEILFHIYQATCWISGIEDTVIRLLSHCVGKVFLYLEFILCAQEVENKRIFQILGWYENKILNHCKIDKYTSKHKPTQDRPSAKVVVFYHYLISKPELLQKWVKFTNRDIWTPIASSVICKKQFHEDSISRRKRRAYY